MNTCLNSIILNRNNHFIFIFDWIVDKYNNFFVLVCLSFFLPFLCIHICAKKCVFFVSLSCKLFGIGTKWISNHRIYSWMILFVCFIIFFFNFSRQFYRYAYQFHFFALDSCAAIPRQPFHQLWRVTRNYCRLKILLRGQVRSSR